MDKEKLREIVKKSVEEVWYNRRSMNPVADQTELLTEALHQALSMSGVVEQREQLPKVKHDECCLCGDVAESGWVCEDCKKL